MQPDNPPQQSFDPHSQTPPSAPPAEQPIAPQLPQQPVPPSLPQQSFQPQQQFPSPMPPQQPAQFQPQPSAQPGAPLQPQPGFGMQQPHAAVPSLGTAKKRLLLIAGIAVVVIASGVAAFLLLHKSPTHGNASQAAQQSSNAASSSAKAMNTFSHVTFTAPSDMSGFTAASSGLATQTAYTLNGTGDSLHCSLLYGMASQTDLPGSDVNSILEPQLKRLTDAGATVSGPAAGTPLLLKDGAGKQYSMPTLEYTTTLSGLQEVDHYSIVVLASGERAVVTRACAARGTVDASALAKVDVTAQKLTVSGQ
ncbi:MAG TPA: hypothetical protein VLI54_03165 [Bacillota bacterium]|nr:hypothetical protein [Bacillota bacterium]